MRTIRYKTHSNNPVKICTLINFNGEVFYIYIHERMATRLIARLSPVLAYSEFWLTFCADKILEICSKIPLKYSLHIYHEE